MYYVTAYCIYITGRYWKLKEEALYWTVWRTHFGRGYGPVVRQTAWWWWWWW
jgi:hypothetical protein